MTTTPQTNRELDAWIAEHLYGWVRREYNAHRALPDPSFRGRLLDDQIGAFEFLVPERFEAFGSSVLVTFEIGDLKFCLPPPHCTDPDSPRSLLDDAVKKCVEKVGKGTLSVALYKVMFDEPSSVAELIRDAEDEIWRIHANEYEDMAFSATSLQICEAIRLALESVQ